MKREDFKPGVVFCRKDQEGGGFMLYELNDSGQIHMYDPSVPDIRVYVGAATPTRNNKGFNLQIPAITHTDKAFVKFSELEVVS